MDYKKIGELISTERKSKNLTQSKLAKKLFISEKTISKWENGNGVPDTESLTKLCQIFEISVNELLNGERISSESYTAKAEDKLLELKKEKENADKRLLNLEIVLGSITIFTFLVILCTSMFAIYEFDLLVLPIILIIVDLILTIIGITFCFYIEQKAGYYECKKCHHKYIPTFNQALWAPHMGRTKHMKCPHCKQKSWSKKVIK